MHNLLVLIVVRLSGLRERGLLLEERVPRMEWRSEWVEGVRRWWYLLLGITLSGVDEKESNLLNQGRKLEGSCLSGESSVTIGKSE